MATQNQSLQAPLTLPDPQICEQARRSRDPRFDGLFFIGVLTTGVYCRTICPARIPAEANVRYFTTGAAALAAGFRPCLRCRPEQSRLLPEWTLASDTVVRALRLIEAGYLNEHNTQALARRLNMGERQLNRLVNAELGTTPKMLARMCRAKVARHLLRDSHLKLSDIAFHAGYNSISRFNAEMRAIFKTTPGKLRRAPKAVTGEFLSLQLPVREPYSFDWIFNYLQRRQLPGLEEVSGDGQTQPWRYRRKVGAGVADWLEVHPSEAGLRILIPPVEEPVHQLLHRVRMVFDLYADGVTLHEFLSGIPRLQDWVHEHPGLRVAGAWDGFETSVRAILGQQVSVERGTELAINMMHRYGGGSFPQPKQLIGQDVAELGMPGRRGRAVVTLAEEVVAGNLCIDECQDYDALVTQLTNLEGVGPWTANYIRMRVLKDPDAFPDNDWVVLKELNCTAAQARRVSSQWQPWRAYALMYLWYAAGQKRLQAHGRRKTKVATQ